ncbi:hypothetical protein Lepto7375DRAFT_7280 [Leptolyngbya sp. PCC 7375]|nr:hypothetical protein Lepto7375DRAFT_7280 [Leptolyngbya sp. PCC 7375]
MMTKRELINLLEDVPDDAVITIPCYDAPRGYEDIKSVNSVLLKLEARNYIGCRLHVDSSDPVWNKVDTEPVACIVLNS